MRRGPMHVHIRNALEIVDELLKRKDVDSELKAALLSVKRELYAAQDEVVWARSRARELLQVVRELSEALGLLSIEEGRYRHAYVRALPGAGT